MTQIAPIDLVTASAGTGKTHRLAEEFIARLDGEVGPGAILATTFTRKAAAELLERVRQRLIAAGRTEAAQMVLGGYIGTVNAVFGRLASEFALEAGRSPVAEVIAEDRADALFAIAAEAAIADVTDKVDAPARRLCQDEWRGTLRRLVALSRQNDIAPDALAASAQRSWQGLASHLPMPAADGVALDTALQHAVTDAIAAIEGGTDTTKETAKALDTLRTAARNLAHGGGLTWEEWSRLAKLKTGKLSRRAAETVSKAASVHPSHPRLHADLKAFIEGLFHCAADALTQYARFKAARGLVDFVDQEQAALALFDCPAVADALAERFAVALVDEVQDTSPIQLALFLKLARLVRHSVWVGDPKQSIYGFRGTDPDLIRAVVARLVPETGGRVERLTKSWRARPGLVSFVNDVFGAAFPPHGIPAEDVRIEGCERTDLPGQQGSLAVWTLNGKAMSEAAAALASGVADLLADPAAHPVGIKETNTARPLRGADIAVLCRTHDRCTGVAEALAAAGVTVAIGRPGLMDTPEARLAVAALRCLVDPSDTLAPVEIAHLTAAETGQPDWFERCLSDSVESLDAMVPALGALKAARSRLPPLTPAEALDLALGEARVAEAVTMWTGAATERLANLDAVRALALAYQDDCRARRAAATPVGLVAALRDARADAPPSLDPTAVQVMTYHAAKGLEWPVVILTDLDHETTASPFGLTVEGPDDGLDPWRPLAGRWLRLWPWPYGRQSKDVYLDAATADCPEAVSAAARARAEAVRLLYVGMTRARDTLILAVRPAKDGSFNTGGLDALTDGTGAPALAFDLTGTRPALLAGATRHPAVSATPAATGEPVTPEAEDEEPVRAMPSIPSLAAPHPALHLVPSSAVGTGSGIGAVVTLGNRLPLVGDPDMQAVGDAMHRFLAVDRPQAPAAARRARAAAMLDRWRVSALRPEDLLTASDRLDRFLSDRWPGARRLTEWPVSGRVGLQRARGWIDLLLETGDGFVLIDHKSFPGGQDQWPERAAGHGPQLAVYRTLVEEATGRTVLASFIHMPVAGVVLPLQ